MEINKLYLLYLKNWNEPIWGILNSEGKEWIFIKKITNDYLHDGYALVRRKKIKKIIRDSDVLFKENVLIAKGYMNSILSSNIPMDSLSSPLIWLCGDKKTVLLSPKDEAVCYMGNILRVSKSLFYLQAMTSVGVWEKELFRYIISDIVTIEYDTDYINSLLAYNRLSQQEVSVSCAGNHWNS